MTVRAVRPVSTAPASTAPASTAPASTARAWLGLAWLGLALLCVAPPGRTHAQTAAPDVSRELELFESTERGLDPLGLDQGTGRDLDQAAARLEEARRRAAQPKPPALVQGDVLRAAEGVRELAHRVQVQLAQGLAFVEIELRFEARSAFSSELTYRLPLPADAVAYALAVCRGARCVEAVPEARQAQTKPKRGAPEPTKHVEPSAEAHPASAVPPLHAARDWVEAARIEDLRGSALALRAGSVRRDAELSLRVRYVAPAELHAGVARFRLPARGYDPRIAPSSVSVSAPELVQLIPEGEVTLDPNLALEVEARLDPLHAPRAVTTRARCGAQLCSRRYQAALPQPFAPRETWLLLDASPSMEGRARNAAERALVGMLSLLPEQTPLRAIAFAERARDLGRHDAAQVRLAQLSAVLGADLGSASRPAAALSGLRAELTRTRPRVLLLSDGKLDRAALAELVALKKLGMELWWIALDDAPSGLAAHCDGVVRLANADGARAEELLSAALSARGESGVRAGEQRADEQAPARGHQPAAGDDWLSFWVARSHPPRLRVPGASGAGVVAAPAYVSQAAPAPAADTGMPKESVLSMLRTQLVPQARGCLRSDRKGRGDYAVALTFHAVFADREAYDTRVEGKIPEELRRCLNEVVPRLRIPAFSGRIRVRYPIHTEREPESPVIELEGEALEQVNRVIGAGSSDRPTRM